MPELTEFKWIETPFIDAKRRIDRTTKMATYFALRETGRKIVKVARAAAPTYPGPQNTSQYPDHRAQKESGQLRRAIHNGGDIKEVGGRYQLRVGVITAPKNGRGAPLYANQVERMYGFMHKGFLAQDLSEEYRKALAVGYAKYR